MSNETADSADDESGVSGVGTGAGMAVGIAIGVAIGTATDNLGLWLPLGVAVGASFEAALSGRDREESE